MRAILISCVASLLPLTALAEDITVAGLTITNPVARPTAATAMTGAGYLSITNTGDTADTLLKVSADFARVMMHDTVITDGLARMQHLMAVDIGPGETIDFAPGGKHVMFMGLDGDPFEIGEEIPATLIFETAGEIEIRFTVSDIPDG